MAMAAEVAVGAGFDELTLAKVGKLAAHGFLDTQIAEMLLLSSEEVNAILADPQCRRALAAELETKTNRALTLAEGWDAVEEIAISRLLNMVEALPDPNFVLSAARVANQASRHDARGRKVLNTGRPGDVIVLNLGDRYINHIQANGPTQVNNGPSAADAVLEKKHSDVVTPLRVSQILGVRDTAAEMQDNLTAQIGDILEISKT